MNYTIENCGNCPCRIRRAGYWYCEKADRWIDEDELWERKPEPPEWCPLEEVE